MYEDSPNGDVGYCADPEKSILGREFLKSLPEKDWPNRYKIWELHGQRNPRGLLDTLFRQQRNSERWHAALLDVEMAELKAGYSDEWWLEEE